MQASKDELQKALAQLKAEREARAQADQSRAAVEAACHEAKAARGQQASQDAALLHQLRQQEQVRAARDPIPSFEQHVQGTLTGWIWQ